MKTADELRAAWKEAQGNREQMAKILGIGLRSVYKYLRAYQMEQGYVLPAERDQFNTIVRANKRVIEHRIDEGVIIVGSDAHFWPGERTTAFRGFVEVIKRLSPSVVVLNGDVFDGARISRYPPIGWEKTPTVKEELDAVSERLAEIEAVLPAGCKKLWPAGNHDMRFEAKLAQQAAEFAGVSGIHLKDHFPTWTPCMKIEINDDVVIKHRFKGGIHSAHNSTLWAGKTMINGHLHSLKVTPFTDYNGTRYGVDTGTLAEIDGRQFDYTEDNPVNWRSGFVVLTFHKGKLMMPEMAMKWDDDHIQFRGGLIGV